MVDETKLAILINEYIKAVISADEKSIEKSIKNLHGLETAIEPELIQPFLDVAKSNSPYIREAAVKGLGEFGDTSAIPSLLIFLKDFNSRVRQAAVHSIGQIGYQPVSDSLELFKPLDLEAIRSSARLQSSQVVTYIVDLAKAEALDCLGDSKTAMNLAERYL